MLNARLLPRGASRMQFIAKLMKLALCVQSDGVNWPEQRDQVLPRSGWVFQTTETLPCQDVCRLQRKRRSLVHESVRDVPAIHADFFDGE